MESAEVEALRVNLFFYFVFGLAPTMTMLTSLAAGWFRRNMGLGWMWGLGTALVSSPAGLLVLILFMATTAGKDVSIPSWGAWAIWVVPFVLNGLMFSAFAALMIGKWAKNDKSSTGTQHASD
ncbi:MAG: hypothetical protein OXG33_11785 [Chloroflexi bacterium]|nr:hypothetical protein [Chloroflexota bacterium]